jgi:hypothetical protein
VTVQRPLVEVAATPVLRERQQLVWDWIREVPGGLTADEVGALLHSRKGKHGPDERCQWCTAEGRSALQTVALRQLLVRRRDSGRWEPREKADRTADRGAQLSQLPDWLEG